MWARGWAKSWRSSPQGKPGVTVWDHNHAQACREGRQDALEAEQQWEPWPGLGSGKASWRGQRDRDPQWRATRELTGCVVLKAEGTSGPVPRVGPTPGALGLLGPDSGSAWRMARSQRAAPVCVDRPCFEHRVRQTSAEAWGLQWTGRVCYWNWGCHPLPRDGNPNWGWVQLTGEGGAQGLGLE